MPPIRVPFFSLPVFIYEESKEARESSQLQDSRVEDVAHISFEGGSCFLPASTPYEWDVLFEFLNQSTNRHGWTRLALNHQGWTISRQRGERERCASCHRWLHGVTYAHGNHALCEHCARRYIAWPLGGRRGKGQGHANG